MRVIGCELYGNEMKKYLNTHQRVLNKAVKALFNIDQRFSTSQLSVIPYSYRRKIMAQVIHFIVIFFIVHQTC
jgi:hypothetical protein